MDGPEQQHQRLETMLGAPRINVSALLYILDLRTPGSLFLSPSMSISTDGVGAYSASYSLVQATPLQWAASTRPGYLVEIAWGASASDSASQLGVNSLSGSFVYGFSGNAAISDAALTITLSVKIDLDFEMEFFGIESKSSGGTIVETIAVFTFNYTIDSSSGMATVTLVPTLTENGQPISSSPVCPCPMPAEQVTGLQQQAQAQLEAIAGQLQSQIAGLLEGYGGGPF